MKKLLLVAVLSFGVLYAALPESVHAAEAKILDNTVSKYETMAKKWEPVLNKYAKRLFLYLCVISLVFTAGFGFIRGSMGIGDFFSEFVKFGISMGFFYWLLENGPIIAAALIESMATMGQEASSDYVLKVTPSTICVYGFNLIYDAIAEFGKSDYSTGVLVIVVALIIALVFAVIAAQMVVLLCSSWILIYAGVFFLGFGGGSWTSEMAKNYFRTVLAQAIQVFVFCLLIGIGQTEIRNLTLGLRTTKSVTVPNYWSLGGLIDNPTKVVHSETLTLSGMCVCLVFAVILAILVSRVPGLVAGVINGSSISAMSFSGVGASAGAAMGMVTGGAMMATQAAGAALALNTAYQQAKSDVKAGNGLLSGESGGMKGGLGGAMNTGASFLGNMLSGGGRSMKDDLQKTTMGGKVSAQIEGKAATEAAKQSGSNGQSDKGGSAGGGSETNPSGQADGQADQAAGGDSDSGGSGESGNTAGETGETASGSQDTGGSAGNADSGASESSNGIFDGGGAISAGGGPERFGMEFENDPGWDPWGDAK